MKRHNSRDTWRYFIDLPLNDRKSFSYYIQEELDFYNKLNHSMVTNLRNNHQGFLEIAKKLRLFGESIEFNINVRQALKEGVPDKLKVVEEDLQFLSEASLRVLDSCVIPTRISPRTKRNLGVQMFRYYAQQATAFSPSGNLKFAPQILEAQEIMKKRHFQLHRKSLIVELDDNENTLISVPYSKNKIKVEHNIKKHKWNILIVHQKPNTMVDASTPWCIDLKNSDDDYILKYLDNPRPRSAFAASKNDYRRTSF